MTNEKTALTALARAKAGKGAARAIRRTGQIPGVIYGGNTAPTLISFVEKDIAKATEKQSFFNNLCNLEVAGKKILVLPKDVQLDPVNDRPLHADFMRVTDKTVIRVGIPVHVKNQKDCPGLIKGGVLNLVRHEVEVYCKAMDIPEEIAVDLTGLDVGYSIHLGQVKLPSGVKPVKEGDFTLITLVAPSAMKSEVDEAVSADADDVPDEAVAAEGDDASAAKGDAPAAAPAKDAGKGKK